MYTFVFWEGYRLFNSRDSVVGIATGYGLDDQGDGVRVPEGARIFTSSNHVFNGYRGDLFPGVKWQGREADHSPPASAEVKKI
jgi:hypothetical protein